MTKAELLESLDPDVFRLLEAVSIARSRRQIEKLLLQGELDNIGHFPSSRPTRQPLPVPPICGDELVIRANWPKQIKEVRFVGLPAVKVPGGQNPYTGTRRGQRKTGAP